MKTSKFRMLYLAAIAAFAVAFAPESASAQSVASTSLWRVDGWATAASGSSKIATVSFTREGNPYATFFARSAAGAWVSTSPPAGISVRISRVCYTNPQHTGTGVTYTSGWSSYASVGCPSSRPYSATPTFQVGSSNAATTWTYGLSPSGL